MRAAEKEVDALEKQVVDEAEQALPPGEIKLPMFKELQAKKIKLLNLVLIFLIY